MATATTNAKPTARAKPVPPDERFWKRYSPHHEFPLSSVSSIALHILLLGLLALGARLAYLWGMGATAPQVLSEGVNVKIGGGGGPKGGKVPGPGQNQNLPGERTEEKKDTTEKEPETVKLDPSQIASIPREIQEDPVAKRYIARGNKNVSVLRDMNTEAGQMLRRGVKEESGMGKDGPGRDGGKDGGKDKGMGDASGPGTSAKLNEREKRMLRWVMSFNTRGGGPTEYFKQLSSLGAVIAIPDGKGYKIVYYPPGAPKVKSVEELNRIYWKDYDRNSVGQMMRSLGIRAMPDHFVAFMPQELEEHLFKMELDQARSRGKTIDDVDETRFEVLPGGKGYKAVLKSVTFK
jgi:hypothetical protein